MTKKKKKKNCGKNQAGFIENDGKTCVFFFFRSLQPKLSLSLSLSLLCVHTVHKEVTDVALHREIRLEKKEEIKPRKTKITSVVQVKKISGMLYGLIT